MCKCLKKWRLCNKKIVVVSYDMKGGKKFIRPVIIISVTV